MCARVLLSEPPAPALCMVCTRNNRTCAVPSIKAFTFATPLPYLASVPFLEPRLDSSAGETKGRVQPSYSTVYQCTYACTDFFSRWQRNSIAVLPSAVKPKILRWRFRDCHCELSCVILSEGRAGKRFVALRESHKVQTQTPPSMFGCGEVNE